MKYGLLVFGFSTDGKLNGGRDGFMKQGFMMIKRRNGFDITRDILEVCLKGSNKTHIVYAANLNSKRITSYLEFCIRMKLLTKKSSGEYFVYRTTAEGLSFMRNYFGDAQLQNGYELSNYSLGQK
jgi:predicted transcriptional regulator